MEEAKQFKSETQVRFSEKLAKIDTDGVALGDRSCFLVHGMGHVLNQNYLYDEHHHKANFSHDGSHMDDTSNMDSNLSSVSKISPKVQFQNTFLTSSILPLEYVISWDGLRVHKWSERKRLEHEVQHGLVSYPPNSHILTMEEPDGNNLIKQGYVRLRTLDECPSFARPSQPDFYEYDYCSVNDLADKIEEVRTESDLSSTPRNSDSEEFVSSPWMRMMSQGQMDPTIPTPASGTPIISTSTNEKVEKWCLESTQAQVEPSYEDENHRSKETPKSQHKSKNLHKKDMFQVRVTGDPPEPHTHPPRPPMSYMQLLNPERRSRQKVPKIPCPTTAGLSGSSGYSTALSRSRSSSVISEDIRQKWRSLEVKRLWHFPPKKSGRSRDGLLPPPSFMEVQVELDDDVDEEEGSDSDSMNSQDTKIPMDSLEPSYEHRIYLNSNALSSEFCSEFTEIGSRLGMSRSSLVDAIVLGTTIRLSLPIDGAWGGTRISEGQHDLSRILVTFTPSIQSRPWPPKSIQAWKMEAKDRASKEPHAWPTLQQIDKILKSGCNLIPLGYRDIKSTQVENLRQSLEWKIGFGKAEGILLDGLNGVHWRCFNNALLLFRAFLSPLGPLGIEPEHFRNILYFMCQEEFHLWNEEQPGLHLKALLQKVYECLGSGDMPNYFIRGHNMLKSIPSQNTRKVQGHLSQVKSNLLIHCLYAFHNLRQVRDNYYPMPKFRKLFTLLTTRNEEEIMFMANPALKQAWNFDSEIHENNNNNEYPPKHEKVKRRTPSNKFKDEPQSTLIREPGKEDRTRARLQRKYEAWERQQRKIAENRFKIDELEKELKGIRPEPSTNFIDLTKTPAKIFSSLRTTLILKFFMKHFIKMAIKSNEFGAYSQGAMYTQHVENLAVLLSKFPNEAQSAEEFKEKAQRLRQVIGGGMREYIRSRIPDLETDISRRKVIHYKSGPFSNNWDFRKPSPTSTNTNTLHPSPNRVINSDNSDKSSISLSPSRAQGRSSPLAKSLESLPIHFGLDDDFSQTKSSFSARQTRSPNRTLNMKFIDRDENELARNKLALHLFEKTTRSRDRDIEAPQIPSFATTYF